MKFPREDSAHALLTYTESMLIPKTWVSFRSNSERSSSYAGICTVQTGVNANG